MAKKFVAIDCEMVETVRNKNALARVAIVDEEGKVLLDEYTTPPGTRLTKYILTVFES